MKRHNINASEFIRHSRAHYSARELARVAGVSDRTIRRWSTGEDWAPLEKLNLIVDHICDCPRGALPIYRPDMAIDGNTRVGGVGEYTRKAAQGWGESCGIIRECVDHDN